MVSRGGVQVLVLLVVVSLANILLISRSCVSGPPIPGQVDLRPDIEDKDDELEPDQGEGTGDRDDGALPAQPADGGLIAENVDYFLSETGKDEFVQLFDTTVPFQTRLDHSPIMNARHVLKLPQRQRDLLGRYQADLSGYDECAVVGPSALVRRHERGSDIDKADVVIRMKDYPTQNYERWVGSRCDISLNWTTAFLKSCKRNCFLHYRDGEKSMDSSNPLCLVGHRLFDFVESLDPSTRLTNGAIAILVGLRTCKHVTVYGLDFYTHRDVPCYYMDRRYDAKLPTWCDKKRWDPTSPTHNWNFELRLFKFFETTGRLRLIELED